MPARAMGEEYNEDSEEILDYITPDEHRVKMRIVFTDANTGRLLAELERMCMYTEDCWDYIEHAMREHYYSSVRGHKTIGIEGSGIRFDPLRTPTAAELLKREQK